MVTHVDQSWKPLLEGMIRIDEAVEEIILDENNDANRGVIL